jgi:hypothetical protein
MKINLPIQKYSGWCVVEAEIVSIAEWMPGSFAVHRNPYTWESHRWSVSNIETGARCGKGATRRLAIENARANALAVSRHGFLCRLKKMCKTQPQVLDTSVAA